MEEKLLQRTENQEELLLTPAQTQEMDVRLEAYRRNPDEGSPWQEVRKRILENRDLEVAPT
ncbi:MAG: addiction module protein [Desulfuromonadales bacterium]|nr:addiction module protein [Desulfuromonadales bacterium]